SAISPMLLALFLATSAGVGSAFTLKTRDATANVYTSCVTPNTVALTFDDGPYQWSKNVTDTVTAAGGHCTFFVNGNNWDCIYGQAQLDSLAYAYKAGHQIANHGWAHQDLPTLNKTQSGYYATFFQVQALRDIIGAIPAYLRPPYGNYNDDVRTVAAARNKSLVIWDFDSGDSTGSTSAQSKQAYDDAKSSPTGTLLALNHETSSMFDLREDIFDVLPHAISVLKAYGYKLVTVAECLGAGPPYILVTTPNKPNVCVQPTLWSDIRLEVLGHLALLEANAVSQNHAKTRFGGSALFNFVPEDCNAYFVRRVYS
ncbi:carbohydrate esterase family 4 protein, partial [Mycena filopes]